MAEVDQRYQGFSNWLKVKLVNGLVLKSAPEAYPNYMVRIEKLVGNGCFLNKKSPSFLKGYLGLVSDKMSYLKPTDKKIFLNAYNTFIEYVEAAREMA